MPYTKPQPGMPCILRLGERDVELRFTLRVLRELQAQESIAVLSGEGMRTALQDPATLAKMLYYGIRTKQPDITEAWVEDNVDASMLMDLAPVLAYATTGRWPDMSKLLGDIEGTSPNPTRPNGLAIGSLSGQSGASTSD